MGKSLSLILALVFVLGLCTVGSNAAFSDMYSDAADVTPDYLEAIEVLTGLQIINGYKDGTFGPSSEVTRAEAAAMIARMMLGRESADKLPIGEVKFTDVADTHWAVQYIAFCANKGIIVGMGNGTFCPNDPVTGTQLAAMLLRALGYDAMGEYQGKGWDINAVADALYYSVFDDSLVVDFSQPATREETALYIWNTLWINLVGYDVDLNYYAGKTREIDGKTVELTFANDAFDLKEIGYNSRTNRGTYVVLGNHYTGEKYTIVGRWDVVGAHQDYTYIKAEDGSYRQVYLTNADGTPKLVDDYGWRPMYYLDYETDLDMFGHEVTVYIENDPQDDFEEHVKFYKTYLIKDESTELDVGDTLDDFYRAAKQSNQNNLRVRFNNVKTISNYDYNVTSNYSVYATFPDFLTYLPDGDNSDIHYDLIGDVKGQKSKNDGAPSGTWILDHAGNVLVVLTADYRVAKVTEVDTDHDEVVLDIWLDGNGYVDGPFDVKWDDIDLVYDGIAKNDYVQVVPVGKLFYINPTTTKTADITDTTTYGWFNGIAFQKDMFGYGIPIPNKDSSGDVGVGDKVKFYVIEGIGVFGGDNYFGLEIIEKAKTEGIVYVNFIGEFIAHGDWDEVIADSPESTTEAKLNTVMRVQGINQEGEEVVYTFTKTQWDKLVAAGKEPKVREEGGDVTEGGIYEVRKQGNSYFFDNSERALKNVVLLENDGSKGSYLISNNKDKSSDIYFVTNDTKVIYWTGEGADLDIEVVSKLAKAEYEVFALTKSSGGSYKLNTVWVLEDKKNLKIPDDYPVEGFVYVANAKSHGNYIGGTASSGDTDYNGETQAKYTIYKDGEKDSRAFVTGEDIFLDGGILKYGFYRYKDENGDGILELKQVTSKVHKGVKLGKNKAGNVEEGFVVNGLLFAEGSNAASLKGVTILDISDDTTSGTRTNTEVYSPEELEAKLEEGYQLTVDYTYILDDEGNEMPVGVMYVTDVQTPQGTTGSK